MSAYIVECENQEPGEKVWFPSLFEAEQTIVPNTYCPECEYPLEGDGTCQCEPEDKP